MPRKPEILISERAERDLEEIFDYVAAQSTAKRAGAVLRKIANKISLYATSPGAGRKRDELMPGMRSFVIFRYVVFYEALNEGIRIIRVLHGARDMDLIDFDDEDDDLL